MASNTERDIDVLRAHAIAGALKNAKPANYQGSFTKQGEYDGWLRCVRQLERVVCSRGGVTIVEFHRLCGVE